MKRRVALASLPALFPVLGSPSNSQALMDEPGITAREIIFGQTCDLSASRAAVAQAYNEGTKLLFDLVNKRGGINGRALRIIQADDGYSKERALQNTRQLKKLPVFAMLHSVGTAITGDLIPYLESEQIPLLHPLTGADEIRSPTLNSTQTFYLRASYLQEVRRIVAHLKTLAISRVALVHEDEPFGHGIRAQVETAIKEVGLSLANVGLLPFNKPSEVFDASRKIYETRPEAVIIGSAGPSVENFIAASYKLGNRPTYYCLSVCNVHRIYQTLGPISRGIVVAQVMPALKGNAMPIVREYLALSAAPTSFGLEGFISAKLIVQALEAAGPQPTRAKLVRQLEKPPSDKIGGFPIGRPPTVRNGSPFVELAMIDAQGELIR